VNCGKLDLPHSDVSCAVHLGSIIWSLAPLAPVIMSYDGTEFAKSCLIVFSQRAELRS